MAITLLQSYQGGWGVNDGVTQYCPVGNMRLAFLSTEAQAQIRYRFAGTLSRLHVRVSANTLTNDATIMLRKNGADTALVVTIPAGTTGEFVDNANTVTVASTDLLAYRATSAAGGTSITYVGVSVTMDADVDRKMVVGGLQTTGSISAASATRFVTLVSDDLTNSSEDGVPMRILQTCTARNAYLFVSANARSTDTTWTLRKNGANTAITITVPASGTGIFEDTSNSVALVEGDIVNWQVVTGTGTGALAFRTIALQIDSVDQYQVFLGANGDVNVTGAEYSTAGGQIQTEPTETGQLVKMRAADAVQKLSVYVRVNTGTDPISATIRKNGADTGVVTAISASGTGWFDSGGSSVAFADADDLSVGWAIASGSISLRSQTMLMGAAPAAGSLIPSRSHHQPRFYNRRKVA